MKAQLYVISAFLIVFTTLALLMLGTTGPTVVEAQPISRDNQHFSLAIRSAGTTYFDDFSSYTPGLPPTGWLIRGSATTITPTIEEIGGTGPAYRLVSFPEVPWEYWDKSLLKNNLILSSFYTVTVKLNFQNSVADRAGLTIAWDDTNFNRIDIQPNVYWDNIEFRVSYDGPITSSVVLTDVDYIPIDAFTDYWLRAVATDYGPGQGKVIVYWSTDNITFQPVVTATGLAELTGLAGISTAGPHLPHTYFDDFSVSSSPDTAPPNDDFDNAFVIDSLPYSNSQDTSHATGAPDDPDSSCFGFVTNDSVWYRYTASDNSTVSFDTDGSDYDTWMAIYTGSRSNLTEVACNDDYPGLGTSSRVDLDVIAGTTYHLLFDRWSEPGQLTVNATLVQTQPVTCDTITEIPTTECQALEAFYNSTNGDTWGNWFDTNTPCSTPWTGIGGCTIPGNITQIDLINLGISGTIPPELGNLADLEILNLSQNQLSGNIPSELGNLTKLYWLDLSANQLSGSIPAQLGNTDMEVLYLDQNQLSGTIPAELGNLNFLGSLNLSQNQLNGNIPTQFSNLSNFQELDLGYNMLTASDPALIAWLNANDPDWDQTQTVPPTNVQAVAQSTTSVQLTWTPILYTGDGGYYEVSFALSSGGPYTVHGTTGNKSATGYLVAGLSPNTTYCFRVRTYTPAHGSQQNNLWSEYSEIVCETTLNAVVANFTGTPTSGTRPLTVNFTDQSTGNITTWSWDFGDGGTSTQQHPSHTYNTVGDFTVSLTVTGPVGSDTKTMPNFIHVGETVVADFIGTPTSGARPLTVNFTDQSMGDITSWSWDFGDGGSSTQQNPSHIYNTTGDFTVSLTVTGPGGSDTKTRTNYIHVTEPTCYTLTRTHTGTGNDPIASPTNSAGCSLSQYMVGEAINVTASPASGWEVASWNGTDNDSSTSTSNSLTMPASDHTVTVNYIQQPTVQFSAVSFSVNEGNGSVTIEVTRSGSTADTVTVNYATSDGTATAGSDYTATSGTLTFAPGQISQTFSVSILEDTTDEPNEVVNLTLSAPNNATLGSPASATLTIVDNDGLPSVQFSPTTFNVNENSGVAAVEVTLSPASTLTVMVDYATSDGTATAGSDYTATSGTLTFVPGQTSQTFSVAILEDVLDESNETINLILNNVVNAVLGTPSSATLTIVDNDVCYTLTTDISPSGGGSVSASPPPNCVGGKYSQNTNVQLTAIENTGYTFSHWSGSASGSANPTTVTMNGNKNVTANFNQVPFSCNNVTEIPQMECQALVALYNSTDGANWTNNNGWLATNTPCSWYKVSCDVGHVDSLDLYTNNLNGTIPPEIGNLSNLFKLDVSENPLSGSIPSEIGNLQSLDILYLSYTQLSGAIPPELGNLALLRTLRLNDTQLNGPLPQSLTNLTNLDQFWFANTNLCEPGAPDFQTWLASISGLMSTGVICTEPTYTISGRVTDGKGNPIPQVTISAGSSGSATTDDDGIYTITDLSAGTYTLTPILFWPLARSVTIPSNAPEDFVLLDSDGDALFDVWETEGIDLDGDKSLEVNLPAMGAELNKKDVFVQVDWMEGNNHNQKPSPEAIQQIVQAFANSEVDGKGINLHVDVGPDSIDYVTGNQWEEFGKGHSIPYVDILGEGLSLHLTVTVLLHDEHPRQSDLVFHYGFFVHQFLESDGETCYSGRSFLNEGIQVFLVSLGCFSEEKGTPNEQAGTFMHELGHNLGLGHGGPISLACSQNQNRCNENYKPNYLSVMNYSFIHSGLIINQGDGHFDYSKFSSSDLPDLNETSLSELDGLNGGAQLANYGTKHYCSPFTVRGLSLGSWVADNAVDNVANAWVDWDCNFLADVGTFQVDVNKAGGNAQTLRSYNDWDNLSYKIGNIGLGGIPLPITIPPGDVVSATKELTPEEDILIQRISEPRVQLSKTATPDSVQPGGTVTYSITMLNTDASDVEGVTITDVLPPGFSYQAGSTNGATTDDPTIDGQNLTWSGPFSVLENGGMLTLSFRATASSIPGTYFNTISGSSTNGIVVLTGSTASVNVGFDIFLPLIMKSFGGSTPPTGILNGTITDNGIPVAGTELLLRYYDDSTWSTYATTTTDSSGNYQFSSLPNLGPDQELYVLWLNNNADPEQLASWSCSIIDSSTTDPNAYQCSFDVDNIDLLSPDSGVSVSLPQTFSWNKRPITTDDYELNLIDISDFDPWWWTDPSLGYVDNYTLNGLPSGFLPGEQYGWFMGVRGVNGVGFSYNYHVITFSTTGASEAEALPLPARIAQEHIEMIALPQSR
jgi:uncharacterized repeat protein (TIGR01451 family)